MEAVDAQLITSSRISQSCSTRPSAEAGLELSGLRGLVRAMRILALIMLVGTQELLRTHTGSLTQSRSINSEESTVVMEGKRLAFLDCESLLGIWECGGLGQAICYEALGG